jgi:hypothetical protein
MRYDQVIGFHMAALFWQTFRNMTPGNDYGVLHSQRAVQHFLDEKLKFVGQGGVGIE